ncbi:RsfA family transcriptional regulator [Halobacillus seohaensis]|uniref:RsfA family transcriptional regulator n=1 Tax=Halobacillus seohaensis TaxID=447421 RepID=A0ABW2EID5_9BACI
MPKVRQDAWSHEDDLLLAETVLRHIREGGTQLKAFDEVGDVLNRTSAACGFRWNAEIRQKYEQAVDLAKKQRKEKKRNEATFNQPVMVTQEDEETFIPSANETNTVENLESTTINLPEVIAYLTTLQKENHSQTSLNHQIEQLEGEKNDLLKANQHLHSQLNSLKEDYQAFITIMDRARKMTMFDDQDYLNKTISQMDKSVNLEHLAK